MGSGWFAFSWWGDLAGGGAAAARSAAAARGAEQRHAALPCSRSTAFIACPWPTLPRGSSGSDGGHAALALVFDQVLGQALDAVQRRRAKLPAGALSILESC